MTIRYHGTVGLPVCGPVITVYIRAAGCFVVYRVIWLYRVLF